MFKKSYIIFVTALGLFFMCYLFQRASLLSMTHDESGTTDMAVVPALEIMFSPLQFQTANNHILNSLLMKLCVWLFGYKEWAVRLPNVLSFLLYFSSSVWLMNRLTKDLFIRIAGIFILCSVPYLLDFFALARGYGLANAFGMAAIVLLAEYFYSGKRKMLLFSFTGAALASYSNFTWLNLYLGLWAVVNISFVFFRRKEKIILKDLIQINLYPLAVVIALALLSYKPISYLRTKDEFKWGAITWKDSFHTFLNDVLYGQKLFFLDASQSHNLLKLGIPAFILLLSILLGWYFIKKQKQGDNRFPAQAIFLFAFLILTIVAGTVLQKHLLNTFYIDGRKATLYIPILLAVLVATLSFVHHKNKTYGTAATALFLFCFAAQFIVCFNFKNCREWWYDASSKDAALYIGTKTTIPEKTVAVNWLFRPSFQFYNDHHLNKQISKIVKTEEKDQLNDIWFYYVIGDEIRVVPPQYKIVKRYFWDRFLLQKDETFYQARREEFILDNSTFLANLTRQQQFEKADSALLHQRQQLNWNDLMWKD